MKERHIKESQMRDIPISRRVRETYQGESQRETYQGESDKREPHQGESDERHIKENQMTCNHTKESQTTRTTRESYIKADHSFNISKDVALFGATLAIPSFTKGKSQLIQQEVECSQKLAKVQIHVVIGQMKNKFTILLRSIIPVSLVKCTDDKTASTIDKIVCAALTNLSKSVILP